MAQSYTSVVSVAGGLLRGDALSAGAPITYTLDTGESAITFGSQRISGLTSAQLSQIRTQPFGTVNGIAVTLLEVAGKSITMPTADVSSLLSAIPRGITEVNNNIGTNVRIATAPAPAPAPTPPPATKPVVTETATTVTTRTNGVDIVVDKKSVVTETSTTVTTRTGGVDIVVDKPPPISVNEASLSTEPVSITGATLSEPPLVDVTAGLGEITVPPLDPAIEAPSATGPAIGLTTGITTAAAGATAQDQANFLAREDWRVRLSLAPGANYLYKVPGDKGILAPLAKTDGVIFPYTPGISVTYAANYDQTSITHTNYKINQYQNSSVESVNITCDFTAQDVFEANYLLAVIHFFRTMTKMFYGKDDSPIRGTPPPLCYIYGLGGFQFDALPLAITGFNYSLPQDVDYIKTTGPSAAGTPQPSTPNTATSTGVSAQRLGTGLTSGGKGAMPSYGSTPKQNSESTTWVPTKIQLAITCLPIMSRNAVSNRFSLKDYATGALLHGTRDGAKGGGFW